MSDETPAVEVESPPLEKKSPKGAVLIGALVGAIGIGVAAGLFSVGPMLAKKSGYVVTADSTHAESDSTAAEDSEHSSGGEHEGKEGEGTASNVHLIDNLVLNPAGTGGTRFLMVATAVEFKEASSVDVFKARDAEVRDVLLRVMGAKTVEQLSDMRMRDSLRHELSDSLTAMLPKDKRASGIRRVFFPQFVIQ